MSATLPSRLTAVLGPTNTGKTHLAVERLCAHSSGMIGFPLRLLAREIYDRVVAIKGAHQVALITGEERIEPPGARYYLCTTESMPMGRDFAFVAVDEVQLAIDDERGHIFTDRMLHARGRDETMLLGSGSMAPVIRGLLPRAEIIGRPRFSTLSYAGIRKLSRLPARSAIVAFSVEEVYAVAEMLRRLRGGAAVVMGALSPATRNAQVEMFQSGEVDYLVATDAIGMGLNLDVAHIAFASLRKFDGRKRRRLTLFEMAQIAGRAGRHQRDGSFGTLSGEGAEFTPEEIAAIEDHHFPPIERVYWREAEPRTDSIGQLIADLESRPDHPMLAPAPEAIDLSVLRLLAADPAIAGSAKGRKKVARLWEAASLPDFRHMGAEHHSRFIARLWPYLSQGDGHLPHAMVAGEIARLDNVQGDVDVLSGRIAAARIWAYITQRADWLAAPPEMAARARALEARLSDALHASLKQRFVAKRSSILFRKMGQLAQKPTVRLDDDGAVLVDGTEIGHMVGFRFDVAPDARGAERRLLLAAAEKYLGGIMTDMADAVVKAEDEAFRLLPDDAGAPVLWCNETQIGTLEGGRGLLHPRLKTVAALADMAEDVRAGVISRAEAWIDAEIARHLKGLVTLDAMAVDPAQPGQIRALAAQLVAAGGIAPRSDLAETVKPIGKEDRAVARKAGVTFGALDIYHYAMLKPGAVFWRNALHAAMTGTPMQPLPDQSAVHLSEWPFADAGMARLAGYRQTGSEYLRIDLAERLVRQAHDARGEQKLFEIDLNYATSLGLGEAGLIALLEDAGFARAEAPAGDSATAEEAPSPTHEPAEPADTDVADPVVEEPTVAMVPTLDEAADNDVTASAAVVEPAADADEAAPDDADMIAVEPAKAPFTADGKSFHYPGAKLWFSWGVKRPGRGGRGHGAGRGGARGDDARRGRGKRPFRGTDKVARADAPGRDRGQRRGKGERREGEGHDSAKRESQKPASALAEALSAQFAALKDKS